MKKVHLTFLADAADTFYVHFIFLDVPYSKPSTVHLICAPVTSTAPHQLDFHAKALVVSHGEKF